MIAVGIFCDYVSLTRGLQFMDLCPANILYVNYE